MLWLQAHVHMQEELFTTHNLMCTVYVWLFVSQLHNIYILSDRMLSSPIQLSSDTMFVACHCTTGLCTINSKHERHQERVILVCHSCHSGLLPPSIYPCKTSFSYWFCSSDMPNSSGVGMPVAPDKGVHMIPQLRVATQGSEPWESGHVNATV